MPQGPPELHEEFGDDSKAITFLESRGYTVDNRFCIHKPNKEHVELADETRALDYLWLEWDYAFEND